MEQVRDLNMEADNMQVVLSAISGISKRIKEVHRHTSRSLAVSTSSQVKVCERLYISPAPCRAIGTRGLFPIHSSQERYSIRLQIWRGCWKRIIAHRQEKTLLSYRNCIHHVFYEKYVTDVFSCFCRLPCMKRRKLYENLQINTNLSRNHEKNSIDGTYGHIHVKTNNYEYAQRSISPHFMAV